MTRLFAATFALTLALLLAACDTTTTAFGTPGDGELAPGATQLNDPYYGDPVGGTETAPGIDPEFAMPSSNEANAQHDPAWAHVVLLEARLGEVDLQFVSERGFASCFEYRIDGADTTDPRDNFNTHIADGLWPFLCVNDETRVETFSAHEHVDVRMVFGAERDERFDWTRFYPLTLASKDDCKEGRWADHGFRNQGLCIQYFNTGKDSR
jgi:hypothetical protein